MSLKQPQQFEEKKQIYVLIKRIHLLELVYAYDWIKKEEYDEESKDIIQKYKNLKNIMKNISSFNLQNFARDFKIVQQLKIVENVCQRAPSKIPGEKDDVVIFMHATATFIKVNDIMAMNQQKPVVSQIRQAVQELLFIMRRVKAKLSKQFNVKVNEFERTFQKLQEKASSDLLSQNEFLELKTQIDSMYKMLQIDVQM